MSTTIHHWRLLRKNVYGRTYPSWLLQYWICKQWVGEYPVHVINHCDITALLGDFFQLANIKLSNALARILDSSIYHSTYPLILDLTFDIVKPKAYARWGLIWITLYFNLCYSFLCYSISFYSIAEIYFKFRYVHMLQNYVQIPHGLCEAPLQKRKYFKPLQHARALKKMVANL